MAVCSIRIIIYLQVACYCIYGIHLPLPFEFEGNPYDEVKIMVWDDGSRFRRSADDTIIPAQNLEASFSVKQHPVNLRLSRNDDLTPEVPMYTANEDGIIKEDIKDDHKAFFYQDVSNGAAVFVQTSQSSYCLFGSFFMENDEYFLEPNQRECTDLLVNSTFRVWRSNFSEIQNIDNIDRDIVDDYEPITRKENGRFKRNVADLKIETLFITDYSIYSFWYHKVTVKKESDRPRTTRSVIRQYYAFVINGMDVRFKNIPPKSSGFTISVVFSGIFIADTEAKSPFTEHHKVTSVTPNQVDAFTVLNHTATWLQQQTGLPGFDHAMMFSRYDFARGSYSRIVGKAFIGTMCTPKSVSIVEDRFSFTILEVAVHELGHSLISDPITHQTQRSCPLPPLLQVLAALRFYATGSFYQLIGDSLCVSKSAVGRAVRAVTSLLSALSARFIKFPSQNDISSIRTKFYQLAGFPNVVCCVDGTLIRIRCPVQNEAEFVCRKGYYALNVQMACDATYRFVNCVAKWPGSVHDSRVFKESSLARIFETNARTGLILGDSGYALKRYLMVPYLTPSNRAEENFNNALCRTRVTIEQAFGILKRRFPCLQIGLRVQPEQACSIVVACVVLHNLGIERQDIVEIPPVNRQIVDEVALPAVNGGRNEGKAVRDHIAQTFFAN